MSFENPKTNRLTQSVDSEKNPTKRMTFSFESGAKIEILVKEFGEKNIEVIDTPESNQEKIPGAVTIFIPGWAMGADTESVRKLGEAFAESSKNLTYAISTRAELVGDKDMNVLYEEARAIAKFIKDKGIKEVTLAGHSQGGDKAINVATILQEDQEIQIKGLVLIDSTGLYGQTPGELVTGFLRDSFLDTPRTLAKNLVKNPEVVRRGIIASTDIVFGIIREMAKSRLNYPSRFKNEILETAAVNSRLAELRVPIILISGAQDPISNPEKIIPPGEEEKVLEVWEHEQQTLEVKNFSDPREEFLRKNVFPNSPYIRMVVPEKLGHHGLPLYRSKSVARAALYLLKRFERRENLKQELN